MNASFSRTVIVDRDVGMRRRVLVGERLEQRLARVVDLDVPPVDGDRLGRGLRRRRGRRARGRCRWGGRRRRARTGAASAARQAASTRATMARSPNRRRCIDTTRPPVIRQSSSRRSGAVRSAVLPRPADDPAARSASDRSPPRIESFDAIERLLSAPNVTDAESSRQDPIARADRRATLRPKLSVHCRAMTHARRVSRKPRARSTRPTIANVAEQAGVSVPTVSKVINGRSDVSPETRRRVEAAIREHGYRRSDRSSRAAPHHRADLPRARERVGARDRPRRRARRRPAPPGRRPLRDAGPADARARLDRGGAGPPSDRASSRSSRT